MMLRVDNEYLDFNDVVLIETRSKLFEKIESTVGDFSYAFELAKTSNNMRILGNPLPDVSNKTIYQVNECDLMDDSGNVLRRGFLRVEGSDSTISCSFFSGNYNWISQLTGSVSSAGFSDLDVEINEANIIASHSNTEGIVFPYLDSGNLAQRKGRTFRVNDFVGCVFVKTIFKRLFTKIGVKIQGELIDDPIYNSLLAAGSNLDKDAIDNRSSFAVKTVPEAGFGTSRIEFEDDFTFPYFDGSQGNFSTASHRYNADVKMRVVVDISIITTLNIGGSGSGSDLIYFRKNGANVQAISFPYDSGVETIVNGSLEMELDPGDYVDILGPLRITALDNYGAGSTIRVTPVFLYKTFGNTAVPNMSQQEFVSNILKIFNVVSDYDPFSKTLTLNFFDRIKNKEPIDISDFIEVQRTDFTELVANFGKRNTFSYAEPDDEDLREYNINQFIKYGQGVIEVSNDFIEDSVPVVESDFKSPTSYIHPTFGASTERMNFLSLEAVDNTEFGSVTDISGYAQFNVIDDVLSVGDIARISFSSVAQYEGDWVVASVSPGLFSVYNCPFAGDGVGRVDRMRHVYANEDSSFLLINVSSIPVSDFAQVAEVYIDGNVHTSFGYSFFNLLSLGLNVNNDNKQSLSFGSINDPLSYQRSLVDTYWGSLRPVLDDPVKVFLSGNLPNKIFRQLTPLLPITVKSISTSNRYYLNRTSGYVDSATPCELELIKIS